jgi:hypothetical protein
VSPKPLVGRRPHELCCTRHDAHRPSGSIEHQAAPTQPPTRLKSAVW